MKRIHAATILVSTVLWTLAVVPARAQELTDDPWADMDYGPYKTHSYVVEADRGNHANKGIAIRVDPGPGGVAKGNAFLLFDTDTLRWAAGWTGPGFMDWNSINYNGRHQVEPAIVGHRVFTNPDAPGWSIQDQSFRDTRFVGRGGRRFGPQDRSVGQWKGLYLHGSQVVLSYRVGSTDILELGSAESLVSSGSSAAAPRPGSFRRTLEVGPRASDLLIQVAYQPNGQAWSEDEIAGFEKPRELPDASTADSLLVAAVIGELGGGSWLTDSGSHLRLRLPAGEERLRFRIVMSQQPPKASRKSWKQKIGSLEPAQDLAPLTRGGPRHWAETVTTEARILGRRAGPFVLESITTPEDNPYRSWMRIGGFDFFPDGKRAAVATWMGDVWIVDGLGTEELGPFEWRRIATGLYEPLGLKIRDGEIFVVGRDQITRLHDLDGDGESDFYEAFNHDAQASTHFHEFAGGLETDPEGNFYYGKCAGHDFDARVPQHGTILKVSADGKTTDILASGFRAPNGLALNHDGSLIVTDQEGHWTPENRINWVEPGSFHGYMRGWREPERHREDFVSPLTWVHHDVDRSPSEPVWVKSEKWGELDDSLIYLSYGNGKVFSVLFDQAPSGRRQSAVTELPIAAAPSGLVRGRFHPGDGQLYTCGLFAWSSDRTQPGGFYRVKRTEEPLRVPVGFEVARDGILVRFSVPLDAESASDAGNYSFEAWKYVRQASYGSEDYRVLGEGVGRDSFEVRSATQSQDGRSVFVEIPDLIPVQQFHLEMNLQSSDGGRIREFVHGTIHELGDRPGGSLLRAD